MTTKIIIPNEAFADQFSAATVDDDSNKQATSAAYNNLFHSTAYANQNFYTTDGLAATNSFKKYDNAIERVGSEKTSNAPRVLESLGSVLVDDLTPEDEEILKNRATIYENFDVNLIEPVTTSQAADQNKWHLNQAWRGSPDAAMTGLSTRIGVMDTGIDASHPEFQGKDVSFMEFDRSGFAISTNPRDAGSHGTHVCGIAAGKTCGVAPKADLAVAAVLTTQTPIGMSGTLAQILAGYNWLVHSNHASNPGGISLCDVINASLGGRGFHPYLYSSVQTVLDLDRCLLIAAIGNNGRNGHDNHGSPGNYDIVVGVGATDQNDIVADFSDWGQEQTSGAFKPNLSAPGVNILSAIPGGGYALMSGTSMAAPMVAGAAALAIEKHPGWNFKQNPTNLRNYLMKAVSTGTNHLPRNNSNPPPYSRIGAGRLDLTKI